MVEEFDVIDTVFEAVEKKIREKYVKLFKEMPDGSFLIEWSSDNPYVKAEKVTEKYGIRITKMLSTGGFLLKSPSKTLIVMFPSAIVAKDKIDENDINKIRCGLNHDFYHEFIHHLKGDLSELRVESLAYVLCMEDCINLNCEHLVGPSLHCDMTFFLDEMEDPDEIPVVWDEEWERYYAKIRRKFEGLKLSKK